MSSRHPIKRLLERSSLSGAILMYSGIRDTYQSGGVFQDHHRARVGYRYDAPRVSSLDIGGSPSAVTGFVDAVIADAVYCSAFRPLAHISEKVHKVVPSVADENTPVKVVGSLFIGRFASRPHSLPHSVCGAALATPSVAVGSSLNHAQLWHLRGSTATNICEVVP